MIVRTRLIAALALTLLAGCQPGTRGAGGPDAAAPADLAAEAIEVTTLDTPAGAPDGAPEGAPEGAAAAEPAPAAPGDPAEATPPAAVPAPVGETDPADPVQAAEPAVVKSRAQVACERRGGTWSRIGDSDSRACVRRTRDAGKECRRDSDCQGACLARSRTCAPIDPLFGCNDVLQDNGMRVTLCVE